MYKKRLVKYDKIKFIRGVLENIVNYKQIGILELKIPNNLGHLEHRVVAINKDYVLIYVYTSDENMVDSYNKGLWGLKATQITKIYKYLQTFIEKEHEKVGN